ncbi:MAG: hypothetical protein KXJ49_00515 [Vulcanococcus sp.]|uniref:hypothetical protein n=1 Tax=Vulcanococcus sp. TaxID=2856995 RepID=UPI0025EF3FB5|nr:hypothetical protein [Vulcanococcus sp.]MBW0165964.1 hypothetical protein [Vulcanococcus sp.]
MAVIGTARWGLGLYPNNSNYETEVQIEAYEVSDGQGGVEGVGFKVSVTKGVADLRGLFFDVFGNTITPAANDAIDPKNLNDPLNFYISENGTVTTEVVGKVLDAAGLPQNWYVTQIAAEENKINDLGNGANINGTAQNQGNLPDQDAYDMGIEFGTAGTGKDDIGVSEFFVSGITLEDLDGQYFGVRLTSTDALEDDPATLDVDESMEVDRSGSLKLVGVFDTGNGGEDPVYEGLSPGYWKNWSPQPPGNQVNDWNQDPIIYGDGNYKSFETVFQVNPGDWLISPTEGKASDVSLLQALQLGADLKTGLKRNVLARQATAALLNTFEKDETDPNGAVNYRFSTAQVLDWTKSALTASGWSSVDDKVGAAVSGIDTSTWTTQQSTIFGLADLFAQNNNLGLYA